MLPDVVPAKLSTDRRRSEGAALVAIGAHAAAEMCGWLTLVVVTFGRGGATEAGQVSFATMLAAGLVAPFLGSLLERFHPAVVYRCVALAQAVIFGVCAMAVGFSGPSLYLALVVAFVVVSLTRPVHYSALPQLVDDPTRLMTLMKRSRLCEMVGNATGPFVAGAALAIGGQQVAFFAAAVLAIVSMAAASFIRIGGDRRQVLHAASILGEGSSVFTSLRQRPGAISVLVLGAVQFVVIGTLEVLAVAFVGARGAKTSFAGVLTGLFAVGGLAAALALQRHLRSSIIPWLVGGATLLALALSAVGRSPLLLAAMLFAAAGLAMASIDLSLKTLLPRSMPASLLGRVFGLQEMAIMLGSALGAIAVPLLIRQAGISWAFFVVGVIPLGAIGIRFAVLRNLDRVGVEREGATRLVSGSRLFRDAPPVIASALSSAMEPTVFKPGDEVIHQGDRGDHVYLIAEGTADVAIDGVFIRTVGAGDHVGELALLHDVARTATVRATSQLVAWRLGRAPFLSALTNVPGVDLTTRQASHYDDFPQPAIE
jgi:Cyclic nucleotide-binding domain